ncbi:exopolysaccharide biosynthesis protein [Chelativorans sp. M5D2P16]|uniref:exopolysaccharide biosynthesis protein n=1 Tax=Chelativorans sp. M5D2P16 TaxID=3095678 RepID=UPI002AC9FD95|nr:exopolysaccharide biosynthesis protein [Chelativorans sp. M5D2P16]MDZ5696953.1 exopolysaccharide biosynthesis protein [Chelativorans sp. M5D2P16]
MSARQDHGNVKAENTGLEALSGRPAADNPPRRLSAVFEELARNADGPVTVEQFRQALGDRSFAALLVFFSCLNLLPLPPGSTLVLGIPLLLLSVQMVFGRRAAWLPKFVLRKSIAADSFRHFTKRFIPRLKWAERFIRPRYWPFARSHADRIIGSIALILSIAVTLPIPLGNWFPAFSCALVGLALSERDGVLLSIAVVSGALSLAVIAVVVGAASLLAGVLIH